MFLGRQRKPFERSKIRAAWHSLSSRSGVLHLMKNALAALGFLRTGGVHWLKFTLGVSGLSGPEECRWGSLNAVAE